MAATGLRRPDAQTLLGRFLFSGWDEHEKPVAVLSGGERRRLALALVVASGANFLVLDEPTNHLDVEIREALEAALEAFPGTVLLVTHDRALLDAVSGRVLAIEDQRLVAYAGGWAEYVRRDEAAEAAAAEAEDRQAEGGAPEAPTEGAEADVARARRARGRARRGARRRARAAAGRGLDERRSRRGPPRARATTSRRCSRAGRRCSRKPRPEPTSPRAARPWPFGHVRFGRAGYPPPAPMRSSLSAKS